MSHASPDELYQKVYDAVITQNQSPENVTKTLTAEGYPEESVIPVLKEVARDYKTQLFKQISKRNQEEELKKGGTIAITIIAALSYFAGFNTAGGMFITSLIAGIIAFYCFKTEPWAAVTGAITFIIVSALVMDAYFKNRSSFFTIEMLFPLLAAGLAGMATYFITRSIFYTSKNQ